MADHPLSRRIADVLGMQPDARAIEYESRWFSWDQVAEAARRTASLTAEHHADPRIGMLLRNRPGHVAAFLGVLLGGGTVVTINPSRGDDRTRADVAALLEEAEAAARSACHPDELTWNVVLANTPFQTANLAPLAGLFGPVPPAAIDLGFWTEAALLAEAGEHHPRGGLRPRQLLHQHRRPEHGRRHRRRSDVHDGRDVLARIVGQIANPVRWDLCLETMADLGVTGILEMPPAGTLTGIAKRALPGVETFALKTPDQLDDARAFCAKHAEASVIDTTPTWLMVVSPSKGTFHRAEEAGDAVVLEPGAALGDVASLRDRTEVRAPHGGQVVEWLVEDGDLVSPGQPLVRLHPVGAA